MRMYVPALLFTLGATFLSCSSQEAAKQPEPGVESEEGMPALLAVARVAPLSDSGVTGTVNFTQAEGGVQVDGRIQGLEPGTTHGVHLHERGDCSAPDGSSAGGHFAPLEHPHGAPGVDSHVGDLGNIVADQMGAAEIHVFAPQATLEAEQPTSILDRALIVHDGADDLNTQPSGDSGARVACGVVQLEIE